MSFITEPVSIIPLRPQRKIGEINVKVVIQENTNDTLTITKQPVQQGASITDHAYKEPTVLGMTIYFASNDLQSLLTTDIITNPLETLNGGLNGLSKIYRDLLDLQNSRVPIDIITPKRIYKNMLISTLAQTTDKNTENVLKIDISFQEVIIVSVSTTQVARIKQRIAAVTGKIENAGKKSALRSLKEGIGALFR